MLKLLQINLTTLILQNDVKKFIYYIIEVTLITIIVTSDCKYFEVKLIISPAILMGLSSLLILMLTQSKLINEEQDEIISSKPHPRAQ